MPLRKCQPLERNGIKHASNAVYIHRDEKPSSLTNAHVNVFFFKSLSSHTLSLSHVPASFHSPPSHPFQMPFSIQIVRCPKCNQPVYHAEEVPAAGKKWHKTCFKCGKITMAMQTLLLSNCFSYQSIAQLRLLFFS